MTGFVVQGHICDVELKLFLLIQMVEATKIYLLIKLD